MAGVLLKPMLVHLVFNGDLRQEHVPGVADRLPHGALTSFYFSGLRDSQKQRPLAEVKCKHLNP